VSQAESEIKAEEGAMGYKESGSHNGKITLLPYCFNMSSTPSTSNMAPVPIIVPMDVDVNTDSKVEQRE